MLTTRTRLERLETKVQAVVCDPMEGGADTLLARLGPERLTAIALRDPGTRDAPNPRLPHLTNRQVFEIAVGEDLVRRVLEEVDRQDEGPVEAARSTGLEGP